MVLLKSTLSTLVLAGSALLVSGKTAPARDASFPSCDNDADQTTMKSSGITALWQNTNDKVNYVAPGTGACGQVYTDFSNIVCLNPGWVNSANVNGCDKWVVLFNPDSGVSTYGRVADACGAVVNSTFGCNDIFVGKRIFEQLAGRNKKALLAKGSLEGNIQWNFVTPPCYSCYAGLPGKLPDGSADDCTGQDNAGFTRCGRKKGGDRITGPASNFVCSQQVDSCDEANSLIPNIAQCTAKPKDEVLHQPISRVEDKTSEVTSAPKTRRHHVSREH